MMKFFKKEMNCDIWIAVKNGLFVIAYQVNGIVENKPRKHFTKEDKEKVWYMLKTKVIITTTLGIDVFLMFLIVTL